MKSVIHSKRILITGGSGFTGYHLSNFLQSKGIDVFSLKANLLDKVALNLEINSIKPHFVIHLGAMSFVANENVAEMYRVNVEGTVNLLEELKNVTVIQRVILASSATVYGNQKTSILSESLVPMPVNHYGCSKLAMECMSQNYKDFFSIIITRPFNYTGAKQNSKFLIPKIVNAYKNKQNVLELGNLNVSREFNDIRDVCRIYNQLLNIDSAYEVINICSGQGTKLLDIISHMNSLSGYEIDVKVNPLFVRKNEINVLVGDTTKLQSFGINPNEYSILETLTMMYRT